MEARGHLQRNMYNIHRLCSKKYGEAIVVFDGYGESSTKNMVHQRRSKGHTAVAVTFTEDMKLTVLLKGNVANERLSLLVSRLNSHATRETKRYSAVGSVSKLGSRRKPVGG